MEWSMQKNGFMYYYFPTLKHVWQKILLLNEEKWNTTTD